jgi:hypothetical protein
MEPQEGARHGQGAPGEDAKQISKEWNRLCNEGPSVGGMFYFVARRSIGPGKLFELHVSVNIIKRNNAEPILIIPHITLVYYVLFSQRHMLLNAKILRNPWVLN